MNLTNILATVVVTLVTNVTERFPEHSELRFTRLPSRVDGFKSKPVMVPDANPTNKWVGTKVMEVTELSYDWFGHRRERHQVLVSANETELVLSGGVWIPKPTQTAGFISLFAGQVRNGTNSLEPVTGHINHSNKTVTIRINDTNNYSVILER